MRFVIVTGMSGAGKSTALKILEDAGYFCVDNLPIPLLEKFAQFIVEGNSGSIQKVALGVDVRSGGGMEGVQKALEEIRLTGLEYEILFLDAEDEVLVKRYKETRRTHPLAGSGRVENGIREERRRLKYLKEHADYILDSSQLLTRELKAELDKIFVKNLGFKNLMITVLSFGFKYGIPSDSDLVFDVRFLPNPYYIDELRPLSGNDKPVSDYVMNCEASRIFLDKLADMVSFLIPNYILEGKNQLVVSIGCTGGKHRSVTLANALYQRLEQSEEYGVRIEHRDIGKDAIRKKMNEVREECMSFSGKVKEELSRQISTARHCQIAEIAAILSVCGQVSISANDHFCVTVHTENVSVARKYFTLVEKTFNIEAVIHVRKNVYLKKSNVYRVEVPSHEDTVRILQATKFMSPEQEIADDLSVMSRLVIQKECCKRAFLRGTFLAAGSISDPEKGYHLEIVCSTMERAEQIQSIMKEFELDARIVTRKKNQVVYLKEGSQIVDFLGVVEAGSALMNLENIRIRKEISNNINRKVNCETANIGKTVSAAVKQIEDIRYIETHVGFSQLTEELEETAVCRLRYPEATLKELGEMMNPPVGKSGVNHRLRKLGRIADELRGNKEDYND